MSSGSDASTVARGAKAESLAVDYLINSGYEIIARNFRAEGGEIDIVAWDTGILCFLEVRSRRNATFGDPLATISRQKIRRIVKASQAFLEHLKGPWPDMRFDAVGITLEPQLHIDLIKGAFDAG